MVQGGIITDTACSLACSPTQSCVVGVEVAHGLQRVFQGPIQSVHQPIQFVRAPETRHVDVSFPYVCEYIYLVYSCSYRMYVDYYSISSAGLYPTINAATVSGG